MGEKTEKTTTQIDAEELERRLTRPLRFACTFCPWTFEASLEEGKLEAERHRLGEHPGARQTRRRRRPIPAPHLVKRPDLTEEEEEEVALERRRRAALHGIELA